MVLPTDKVTLEAEITKLDRRINVGRVRVLLGETVAASGIVMFSLADKEKVMAEIQARMPKVNRLRGLPAANESQYQDILDKSTLVKTIEKDELDRYQKAADSLGFMLEVVALEGEYYLKGVPVNTWEAAKGAASFEDYMQALIVEPVISEDPVRKGQLAISIQKPPSEISHSRFLEALRNLK
jgi:hypothetical protein